MFPKFDWYYYLEKNEVVVWVLLTTYLQYLSFHISKSWCKIGSPLTLLPLLLKVYSENWFLKCGRQENNNELLFFFLNKVKEIWFTRQLLVSFNIEFLNCRTQLELSWFKDFEQKRCVYWIFISLRGAYQVLVCLVMDRFQPKMSS